MKKLYIILTDGIYCYGRYVIKRNNVKEFKSISNGTEILQLDSTFWHYLFKELVISCLYRQCFILHWTLGDNNGIVIKLQPTSYDLIDYNWNERIYLLVRERCELDHALSWLSTLGGAFSALGDYFANCAETAGKISFHQLKLALRLGDPSIASRCRLYLSLSFIQKKRYKLARRIIETEYQIAKKTSIVDPRLINMCRGIWSKLQYEHLVYKNRKKDIV
ncbi:uncharacterized protein F58A4.6 [Diabrotica virgifera virgifera]|uniref:Uncharacterized protein F58A4.6 n=1 Tax=Diabrotica virgifera virgifera TaxID=50390 RepID=A0A6P7GVG7_DIAVI|nr:uncharacterized protein F58A4.6 [Diabrotica virgifera virgifera]